ncbi:acyl-CoA dehydrogenase family protein [Sporichthya sp.]|uniref:acyl-CoA dehydrogenase family protein n=1 Tax=Sporichthya sp. TaxID=65475 RepID=UPI0018415826|nr:acyl-CoA dehydrogenase family protein [Sporichthya sp.]MBA3742261.1 hypothetical protein [Sporichthya sp.]
MTIRQREVFDADQEAFRQSLDRFLAAEAVDRYADWDSGGGVPASFYAAAAKFGFVGLAEVEDPRFRAVVLEGTMAAGLPAIALALAMHDSFAVPLLIGREAPGMAAVVDRSGIVAEPQRGGWTLRGSAETVVNGLGAEVLVVAARTDEGSELLFAVDPTAAGVQRAPADLLFGLGACDLADVQFDGVAVTAADRVEADLDRARAGYQVALAVAAMAGARTALAMTVAYVRERKAFGTPIATFGNTRHVLGALGARIAAVESLVDAGLAAELDGAGAAAIKLCATEILGEAVDTGVQLHGGYGYMWEYPIARAYAAARFLRLHGDAGEHLDSVLADAVGL